MMSKENFQDTLITTTSTRNLCQFECKSMNENIIDDNNYLLTNPLKIDNNNVNITLGSVAGVGFFGALLFCDTAKGSIFDRFNWLYFFILIAGFCTPLGIYCKKMNLEIEENQNKNKYGDIDESIYNLYNLNILFVFIFTFLIVFIIGISVISLQKVDVIIESNKSIFLNVILTIIPMIGWIVILLNAGNIKCESTDSLNNPIDLSNKGILPTCRINEDYLIYLQTWFGIVLCGLFVIIGIIFYSALIT